MSGTAFLGVYSIDRPSNDLGCKDKDLRDTMTAETLANLHVIRDKYLKNFQQADSAIRDIASNNRLKNKKVDFDLVVDRAKNYFNFRAMDYYLYRIGYIPNYNDMYREGIQYQLLELMDVTEAVLHAFNAYKGYNAIHWTYGNGSEEWRKAGEPDFPEKDTYVREDLGVFFY